MSKVLSATANGSGAPTADQLATWLTKDEAAAALSCSGKSIERYAHRGLLHHARRPQFGAPPLVVYSPDDIESVRQRQSKPAVVLPPAREEHNKFGISPETKPVSQAGTWGELAASLARLAAFADTLSDTSQTAVYVSLPDAARLSGLSERTIAELAEHGRIATMPFGRGVRYRRADVEAL